MGETWRPISRDEFDDLVAEQVAALDPDQRATLDRYRIEPRQAILRRSEAAGDERVWVIAERRDLVLYFDDVEWGWNWSEVSREDRILNPGGRQGELRGVLDSHRAATRAMDASCPHINRRLHPCHRWRSL